MPGNPHPVHRFQKGQSGNPKGCPKGVVAKQKLKEFTAKTVADAYAKQCMKSKVELTRECRKGEIPIIEHIVGKCLLMDAKMSRFSNLERLLERIIGPVPIVNNVFTSPLNPGNVSSLKDEELDDIIKRNLKAQ